MSDDLYKYPEIDACQLAFEDTLLTDELRRYTNHKWISDARTGPNRLIGGYRRFFEAGYKAGEKAKK